MTRIVCLVDTPGLAEQFQRRAEEQGYEITTISAHRLDRTTRQQLRTLSPDLIIFELGRALENAHVYFFLRSDSTLRQTPIVLAAHGRSLPEHARVLGADGYLSAFDAPRLAELVSVQRERAAAA